jgi:hypothetical protein
MVHRRGISRREAVGPEIGIVPNWMRAALCPESGSLVSTSLTTTRAVGIEDLLRWRVAVVGPEASLEPPRRHSDGVDLDAELR